METTYASTSGWKVKEDVVYICNRTLFSHGEKENPAIWTALIKFEGIILTEISQTEKEKNNCMISLICGFLKNQTHRKQRIGWWSTGARGGEWEKWGDG